jgi:penicillin V acylase-like amidase (Ntn superfamily)
MLMNKVLFLGGALAAAFTPIAADACSRATWLGKDGSVITGRSMDWPYDFNTPMYVTPQGALN